MKIPILCGVVVGLCTLGGAAWAGDFWKEKKPAAWSDKEKQKLLHSSPWAREAAAEMNFAGGGMGGPPGGGGMGGPPGGGMGGPPDGGGPGGMELSAVVRWETSAPVRAASAKPLSAEAEGHYVISITGIPIFATHAPREGGAEDGLPGANSPARRERMLATMREATQLIVKGRPPIIPDNVLVDEEEGTLLVFFAIGEKPIQLSDKSVTFRTVMGPIELKQKFDLKDMVFDGKLSL
jgi:hypothetical protein